MRIMIEKTRNKRMDEKRKAAQSPEIFFYCGYCELKAATESYCAIESSLPRESLWNGNFSVFYGASYISPLNQTLLYTSEKPDKNLSTVTQDRIASGSDNFAELRSRNSEREKDAKASGTSCTDALTVTVNA